MTTPLTDGVQVNTEAHQPKVTLKGQSLSLISIDEGLINELRGKTLKFLNSEISPDRPADSAIPVSPEELCKLSEAEQKTPMYERFQKTLEQMELGEGKPLKEWLYHAGRKSLGSNREIEARTEVDGLIAAVYRDQAEKLGMLPEKRISDALTDSCRVSVSKLVGEGTLPQLSLLHDTRSLPQADKDRMIDILAKCHDKQEVARNFYTYAQNNSTRSINERNVAEPYIGSMVSANTYDVLKSLPGVVVGGAAGAGLFFTIAAPQFTLPAIIGSSLAAWMGAEIGTAISRPALGGIDKWLGGVVKSFKTDSDSELAMEKHQAAMQNCPKGYGPGELRTLAEQQRDFASGQIRLPRT